MGDLESYFAESEGRASLKWKHYFPIYERYFSRFRGTDVHLLEIGVADGGSLQLWKRYFGPDARIFGIDIDPRSKAVEGGQIEVFVGDQEDREFLGSVAASIPRIDIVIDDGGHRMTQQRTAFEVLFPEIDQNGVYVCEDLHTSYWREYGGGYRRRRSFIEYSKGLIDFVNAWHSRSRRLVVSELTRSIQGLHYYDSMLVVEKGAVEPPTEARRGLSETTQDMQPSLSKRIIGFLPRRSLPRRVIRAVRNAGGLRRR